MVIIRKVKNKVFHNHLTILPRYMHGRCLEEPVNTSLHADGGVCPIQEKGQRATHHHLRETLNARLLQDTNTCKDIWKEVIAYCKFNVQLHIFCIHIVELASFFIAH